MLQSALAFEQIIKVSERLMLYDTNREVVDQFLVHPSISQPLWECT